ncbi:MAG: PstS family phosphate ABC transporter substrate-binding protein [Leptolyngbyaceae cyanobacterium]
MSQKNETPALILAFLITAGLIAAGFWWFTQRSGLKPGNSVLQGAQSSNPATDQGSNGSASGSFASVQNVPSGRFNYGGSTSWAPIRLTVDSAIQAARPEFQLRYVDPIGSAPGSASGIRMLIRDELTFAQSSRPVTDQEYQQAQQRGSQLKQIATAIDGLAFAVNPDLKIRGLTLAQIAAIYRGTIRNWQAVGGPNLPIVPLTRPVTAGGTIEWFVESVLQGKAFGPNVETVNTTTEALRRLGNTPGALYFASAPEVVPQCTITPIAIGKTPDTLVPPFQEPLVPASDCPARRNQLHAAAFQSGQYPLTRNLFVVVKQNSPSSPAGEAYANLLLTQEGQDLIAKAGFVKVR